jgi:uncharacterized membrane protein YoaK (UPF0700 family)
MKSVEPSTIREVLLLSLAAGSADAIAFMGLGRVFTSNMTGNLVLLGIDVGQGHVLLAAQSAFVLVLFMGGVALGVTLARSVAQTERPHFASQATAIEKVLLVAFAIGWTATTQHTPLTDYLLLSCLAFAMGLQSAALNRLGAPGVGTTAITGTITALVTGVVATVTGLADSRDRIRFQFGVIAIYGLGAACCGFLLMHLPWLAGCLPALATLCVWPKNSQPSGN